MWQRGRWQLVEQAYDLPYIEVQAGAPATTIPIRCPRYDLHWLYVLEGLVAIAAADGAKPFVKTSGHYYRVSYFPAGGYCWEFARGTHRIFYVSHKARALFREASKELDWGFAPVESLRARLGSPSLSGSLSMADGSANAINNFLQSPGITYLRRLLAIHTLAISLLLSACAALRFQLAGEAVEADQVCKLYQTAHRFRERHCR